MKKSLLVVMLFVIGLAACPRTGPVPVTEDLEYCQKAEEHLKALGCIPKDKPYTAKGKQFGQFCQETMANGVNLAPRCLSQITSCNQMNACVQGK